MNEKQEIIKFVSVLEAKLLEMGASGGDLREKISFASDWLAEIKTPLYFIEAIHTRVGMQDYTPSVNDMRRFEQNKKIVEKFLNISPDQSLEYFTDEELFELYELEQHTSSQTPNPQTQKETYIKNVADDDALPSEKMTIKSKIFWTLTTLFTIFTFFSSIEEPDFEFFTHLIASIVAASIFAAMIMLPVYIVSYLLKK